MEKIDFNLGGKQITVRNILQVSPQSTNFKIFKEDTEVWSGTELKRCDFRNCEVSFMRVVGNPYSDGFIELRIEKEK